jgi:hypothetical protein
MKKLILISALLLFGSNSWADVSMIPLNDYLKQQKMGDPNVAFYTFTRCSAINLKMADRSGNNPERLERAEKVSDHFFIGAIEVRQLITPDDSDAEHLDNVISTVSGIANAYVEVMNVHYPKTGIYFTDWMIDDLSTCSALYEDMIK